MSNETPRQGGSAGGNTLAEGKRGRSSVGKHFFFYSNTVSDDQHTSHLKCSLRLPEWTLQSSLPSLLTERDGKSECFRAEELKRPKRGHVSFRPLKIRCRCKANEGDLIPFRREKSTLSLEFTAMSTLHSSGGNKTYSSTRFQKIIHLKKSLFQPE